LDLPLARLEGLCPEDIRPTIFERAKEKKELHGSNGSPEQLLGESYKYRRRF
jgi:hypothetical protein